MIESLIESQNKTESEWYANQSLRYYSDSPWWYRRIIHDAL